MGWYYNPPPPQQPRPQVIPSASGSQPPARLFAATLASLLTLWPQPYDQSQYLQRRPQAAAITPAIAQIVPYSGVARQMQQRQAWTDLTWGAQSAEDVAPLATLVYGAPPPIGPRYPVTVRDPQRPIYGASWQYGWANATGGFADVTPIVVVNNPPPQGPRYPVVTKDPQRPIYGASWQYGWANATGAFAGYGYVPPPLPPPTIGPLGQSQYVNAWPQVSWNAQRAGNLVQPYPGDEPPGAGVGGAEAPDVQAYGYYDAWASQRAGTIAGVLYQPPAINSPVPSLAQQNINSWSPVSWPAQTFPHVAGIVPPPITSPFVARGPLGALTVNAWPAIDWRTQSAGIAASLVPPPVVSAYLAPRGFYYNVLAAWAAAPIWGAQRAGPLTPSGPLTPYLPVGPLGDLAIDAWPAVSWGAQTQPDVAAIIPPPIISSQPYSSLSYPTLAAWAAAPSWGAQSEADVATLIPPPAASSQPYTTLSYASLTAWQLMPSWAAQSEPDVAPLGSIIYGSPPPPHSIAALAGLRAAWADFTWGPQNATPTAATVPPPVVNVNLQPLSQLATLAAWVVAPTWSAPQLKPFTASGPAPMVPNGPLGEGLAFLWPAVAWNVPTQRNLGALLVPPVPAAQPFTPISYSTLFSWQAAPTWTARSAADAAAIGSSSQPIPFLGAQFYALRATWADATWRAQSESAVASIVPTAIITPIPVAVRIHLYEENPRTILDGKTDIVTLSDSAKFIIGD